MLYRSPSISSPPLQLEIDLKDDLRKFAYDTLIRAGYSGVSYNDAVYQYYTVKKRQLTPRIRRIFYSKEFKCPHGYNDALKEFEGKVLSGQDLMPFMTKKVKDVSCGDLLLFDWGIYHFHLSKRYREDGFVSRSDYQIFAFVTSNSLYAIQIYSHGAPNLYCQREMLNIILRNWPELLEPYRLKGVSNLSINPSDSEYDQLRKAHISSMVEIAPNQVYGLIGGGYMSNGYSTQALRSADYWMNRCALFQLVFSKNICSVSKIINEAANTETTYVFFEIHLVRLDGPDVIITIEINTGLIIQLDLNRSCINIIGHIKSFISKAPQFTHFLKKEEFRLI